MTLHLEETVGTEDGNRTETRVVIVTMIATVYYVAENGDEIEDSKKKEFLSLPILLIVSNVADAIKETQSSLMKDIADFEEVILRIDFEVLSIGECSAENLLDVQSMARSRADILQEIAENDGLELQDD